MDGPRGGIRQNSFHDAFTDIMAATTEIEIKLACGPHHAQGLAQASVMAHPAPQSEPSRAKLVNLYYDTEAFDLRRRKMALRLRRYGYRWLQTLKASGDRKGGVAVRQEWEMPVAGPALNCASCATRHWPVP